MAHKLTWSDRLRIERVVWMLDQRLYDIPRESRLAHRREVRLNLLSAAQDIGTRAALRTSARAHSSPPPTSPPSSATDRATPGSRLGCGRRRRCSS